MNVFYQDYIQQMTHEDWEFFAVDYLSYIYGFTVERYPARGADGGRDGIVWLDEKKYIVSCKHYRSDRAISPSIETNIINRIYQHNANGFVGFYSTVITEGLGNMLKGLENAGLEYFIFDIYNIVENINVIPWSVLNKYGLAKNIRFPLHVPNCYQPLCCLSCGEDILLDENIDASLVQICKDDAETLHYVYGCKRCFGNYQDLYWGELSQVLHHDQFVIWNNIVEDLCSKYNVTNNFYQNKNLFDTRIQQRLVKFGGWI